MRLRWLGCGCGGLMLLAGCASSDRMTRMSGGVFDEYAPPPSYRIRSEKFQAKPEAFAAARHASANKVGGFHDTLVNVWPFFFRSNAYWSILWPVVDFDPFGLAVRPFYNQEGDEYSILFPLSAWNPVNGDGWVLNAAWAPDGFGLIPLSWQHREELRGWCYYTPLFIRSTDRRPLGWKGAPGWKRRDSLTELMLGYYSARSQADRTGWDWLYDFVDLRNKTTERYHVFRYQAARNRLAMPENDRELRELREKIFRTLPVREGYDIGFFPLFSYAKKPLGGREFRMLGLLAGGSSGRRSFGWDLLGPLAAQYSAEEIPPVSENLHAVGKTEFFSLPLMTRLTRRTRYRSEGAYRLLCELAAGSDEPFSRQSPTLLEKLRKLDPALRLPETVTDRATLALFLREWARGGTFPTEDSWSGGCLPLFCYEFDRESCDWFSLALLTGYWRAAERSRFWSLPLLTYARHDRDEDSCSVAPPFIWHSGTLRRSRLRRPILPSDARWAPEGGDSEARSDYAALGLYFHGKTVFSVARPGQNAETLEEIRKTLLRLEREHRGIAAADRKLERDRRDAAARETGDRVAYYQKLARLEELKIAAGKLESRRRRQQQAVAALQRQAAAIGWTPDPAAVTSPERLEAALNEFFDRYTELRSKEDFGSGLWFRRELFYNGDRRWRLLGGLAGGEKNGTEEQTHVLHLLYRRRQEGERSETLFFPFVSIQRDGENERFSFLWRVFQYARENGRSSGYLLFFPY